MKIKSFIEIDIDDDSRFGQVSFFIDKDEVLSDISMVRKQIGLKQIPYSFPKMLDPEVKNIIQYYESGKFTIYETKTLLDEYCRNKNLNLVDIDKTFALGCVWSEAILNRYNKRIYYYPTVLASIFTGKIIDFDFVPTNVTDLSSNYPQIFQEQDITNNKSTLISVNRKTTNDELLKVLQYLKKFKFDDEDDKPEAMKTHSSVKEMRKLYWMSKEPMSSIGIYERLGKTDSAYTIKGIERSIAEYKKCLR